MRRRFTIDDEGNLVDRHGYVLGKVVGLTLDMPVTAVAEMEGGGGKGAGVGVDLQRLEEDHPVSPTNSNSDDPVERIWAVYVETMKPRRAKLDPQARTLIKDALKVAKEAECIGAIRGCRKSRHHMGDNDRGKKYNTISHILRGKRGIRTTREQIDLMLSYDEASVSGEIPSGVAAEIQAAKRTVRQYAPFANNEHAQQLAKAAMDTLKRYDITTTVTHRPNGFGVEILFGDEDAS